jgi:TonB family protein
VVVEAVPPVFPLGALEAGIEATVVLEVLVSADGRVADATVFTPAEGEFAEAFNLAAVHAIRGFRFSPATDEGGAPVDAVIRYALRFVATQAPALSVEGMIREAGTRVPMVGVEVRAIGPDQALRIAESDEEGRWQFAGLPEGEWQITVTAQGLETDTAILTVTTGKIASVTLYADRSRPWEGGADYEITVIGTRPAPEVTERVLGPTELRYLPGTNGDVIKVIQNLPGVARAPLGIGQLLVRGTSPEDSTYFIDGTEIPIVFHFAGLATVVNGDTLQEVSLLPGNYSARYGRQLGGVVDLRTRQSLPDRDHAYISIDLYQTTAFFETRINDRTALSFSGRRSYIDAILNPVLDGIDLGGVQAPRYYDGQLRLQTERSSGGMVSMLLFGSDDSFRVLDDGQSELFGLHIAFLKGQLNWTEPVGRWTAETSLISGPEIQTFAIGEDNEAYEQPWTCGFRHEWRLSPDDGEIGWRIGTDVAGGRYRWLFDVEGFSPVDRGDTAWLAPGLYVEPTFDSGAFELTPGLRFDGLVSDHNDLVALDPRVSARYKASDTLGFDGGFGQYSQFPTFRQSSENPDLVESDAIQTSLGFDWAFHPSWTLEVTGFENHLRGLVVGREDAFAFFTGPPPFGPQDTEGYLNDGLGHAVGVETLLKLQTERTVGWVAATFQEATRTDRYGVESKFTYDQPIVLTALASHQLPKRWRLGGRVRYGSGNPYTPVRNRLWDLDSRTWIPIYGATDSDRLPPYWQVDFRFDKEWVYRLWKLTFYLDLQNVTNRQNVEVIAWTADYSAEAPILGLPIIPAFGLRGEW